jgi:hypothetical protein
MKNSSGLAVLILVIGFALPAEAQDVAPKFEAYAGYDYMRDNTTNDITHMPPSQSVNGNGGSGQLVRPVQAEYFLTKFPDGDNNRQNNFRYSAGIVYRFGGQLSELMTFGESRSVEKVTRENVTRNGEAGLSVPASCWV